MYGQCIFRMVYPEGEIDFRRWIFYSLSYCPLADAVHRWVGRVFTSASVSYRLEGASLNLLPNASVTVNSHPALSDT